MAFKKGQLLIVDNLNRYSNYDDNWAVVMGLRIGQYLISDGTTSTDKNRKPNLIGVEGHGLCVPIENVRTVDILEEIDKNAEKVVVKKEKDFQPKDHLVKTYELN